MKKNGVLWLIVFLLGVNTAVMFAGVVKLQRLLRRADYFFQTATPLIVEYQKKREEMEKEAVDARRAFVEEMKRKEAEGR